jgi:hypothetical protein
MIRSLLRTVTGGAALLAAIGTSTAHAKFVFPYNHPDLDWYSIETEHFVVHYPVSKKTAAEGNEHYLTTEWSAKKTAKVAEEMWEPMCSEFNYYLKEKIHIVLLNQSDDLEGFTIPGWDWIEISANKGKVFSARMRGQMEWFSDVLVHEFAHVVSLKANGTLAEGSQGVQVGGLYQDGINNADIGVDVYLYDGDSVFWTEGGAEYWSDNTGYNWWTAARDMNIRMTVLEGRLLEYDEWHTRAGKRGWNDSERYYQQGYSFGLYLRQRFGDKTYAKFAIEHSKHFRVNWETVVEDVLGIDARTLYDDWVAYVTERYEAQYAEVKAQGEVAGRDLAKDSYAWEFADPAKRDEWLEKKAWKREDELEATGTWKLEPRVSPDGRFHGINSRGMVTVSRVDDDMVKAFTGFPASDPLRLDRKGRETVSFAGDFDHGWDFVPGKDAVVVTGSEDAVHSVAAQVTGMRMERDGYNWKQLWYYDLARTEKKDGNRRFETLQRRGWLKQDPTVAEKFAEGSYYAIPNTKRGTNPAVSPDGKRVAYFEYTDGVQNLVVIDIDGNNKKHLTQFKDGSWMNSVDWSPDGQTLVFELYRQYQQNLYTIKPDGSELKPIMVDAWEEMDVHWANDGRIYFSAEPSGIHNIFSYDPATGRFLQITNVIGGAMSPQLTPEGNLVYTYYSGNGWKTYGLAKEDFYNKDATALFRTNYDQEAVAKALVTEEDLSMYEGKSVPYRWSRSLMAPTGGPMLRLENDSQTNWGLQGGFWFFAQDFVEHHGLYGQAMLGEDLFFLGQYFYQGWHPTFTLTAYHYEVKYDAGYALDADSDPATTDDQTIWEIKNAQYANIGFLSAYYPWNSSFSTGAAFGGLEYGFKSLDDTRFRPYLQEAEASLFAVFSNNSFFSRSANPYFGRNVEATYTHAWTDIVYEPYGGAAVDDGMVLDQYQYNKGELRWTEQVRVPALGGIALLKKAHDRKHVLQVDFAGGLVDRNVDSNDEFRAGGTHPYFTGQNSLRPNTLFAGYPGYSLSGETMGILNLSYRFPISDEFYKHLGPLWLHGVHAQFGGSAGNLWSFRPPEDDALFYRSLYGERVAYDPNDVKREIPFVDSAYKNGNYMLFDAQAELRVSAVAFHGIPWDSFLRVAYGFNEVRGYGDVNGDDIIDTNDSAIGDELSNETEKPGFRFYVGLGTGW